MSSVGSDGYRIKQPYPAIRTPREELGFDVHPTIIELGPIRGKTSQIFTGRRGSAARAQTHPGGGSVPATDCCLTRSHSTRAAMTTWHLCICPSHGGIGGPDQHRTIQTPETRPLGTFVEDLDLRLSEPYDPISLTASDGSCKALPPCPGERILSPSI